jgi:carbamoyl-phosphate synthase large subunit
VNRHLAHAFFRLVCTIGLAVGGFYLLQQPWRKVEVRTVVGVLSRIGVNGVSHVYGTSVLVEPQHAAPFLAVVTPSCSALGALLAFAAIAAFLVPGEASRRVRAALAACALVIVVNVVRIGLSLGVGAHFGSHALVVFHDWIGTLLGLFGVLAGFTLFLFLLLPDDKHAVEATVGR